MNLSECQIIGIHNRREGHKYQCKAVLLTIFTYRHIIVCRIHDFRGFIPQ